MFGLSFWWHPFTAEDQLAGMHVMYCKISPNVFWTMKLIYILDGLRVSTFSANFLIWVNSSLKICTLILYAQLHFIMQQVEGNSLSHTNHDLVCSLYMWRWHVSVWEWDYIVTPSAGSHAAVQPNTRSHIVSRNQTFRIYGSFHWLRPAHEAVWPTCQTTNHSLFRSASCFGGWKCRHNNSVYNSRMYLRDSISRTLNI